MPMMGRFGSTANPDLLISAICGLAVILSMGFVVSIMQILLKTELELNNFNNELF